MKKYKQFKYGNNEYIITNTGELYSIHYKKWMKKFKTYHSGKYYYMLSNSGVTKSFSVGALVLTMFGDIGLPNETDFHINYIRSDNNFTNLKWVDRSEAHRLMWKRKRANRVVKGVNKWTHPESRKKWRVVMKVKDKIATIGYYKTRKEALVAHQTKYFELYGEMP